MINELSNEQIIKLAESFGSWGNSGYMKMGEKRMIMFARALLEIASKEGKNSKNSGKNSAENDQDAFERKFPMPADCDRCGEGYIATTYHAWDAYKFIARWEGWKAHAEHSTQQEVPLEVEKSDRICEEHDGCPTEKAVLQRFWRSHGGKLPADHQANAANEMPADDLVGFVYVVENPGRPHDPITRFSRRPLGVKSLGAKIISLTPVYSRPDQAAAPVSDIPAIMWNGETKRDPELRERLNKQITTSIEAQAVADEGGWLEETERAISAWGQAMKHGDRNILELAEKVKAQLRAAVSQAEARGQESTGSLAFDYAHKLVAQRLGYKNKTAAPEDANTLVGWFDKSANQICWREGLVNADFADRQPFYTHPISAPADAVKPVVAALRKLVQLKRLKDDADRCMSGYIEDRIEYQRENPKAWKDAMAALESFDAAQGRNHG